MSKIIRPLTLLLLAVACVYVAMFFYVGIIRVIYPHEIKWMEGGMLDITLRVLEGQSLYPEPSWDYAPYLYTPFYYQLSAVISVLTGENYTGMRLVSFVSSLAAAGLIGLIVRNESGSRTGAWVAAGFFLAAFKLTDFYLVTGRSDPLFLALALGYVYCARYSLNVAGQVTAGVLGALALLTKQTAVISCVPIALLLFAQMRGGLRFVTPVTGVVLASAGLAALYISSDGWFGYYIFELPGEHRYQWEIFPRLFINQFLVNYAGVLTLAAAAFLLAPGQWLRDNAFALFLYVVLCCAAFLPYMHTGSSANVLLPLQAASAILLGISLPALEKHRAYALALVIALMQFSTLFYLPRDPLPEPRNAQRAEQLVACMAAFPKPVLNTRTAFLWRQAGAGPSIHEPAAADIFRTGVSDENIALRNDLAQRLEDQYYSAVMVGPQLRGELESLLLEHYVATGFNFTTDQPDGSFDGYMAAYTYLSNEFVSDNGMPSGPVCEAIAANDRNAR